MAGAGALLREPSGGFPSPIPSLPFLISSQPSPVLPREHKLWTQPVLGPRPGSALSSCVTSGRWSTLSEPLGEAGCLAYTVGSEPHLVLSVFLPFIG